MWKMVIEAQRNIAACYKQLGREEDEINLEIKCHSWGMSLFGATHEKTLEYAVGVVTAMLRTGQHSRARSFCRAPMEALTNPNTEQAFKLRACAAIAESLFDAAKGVALLEGVVRDARRVLGDEHESVKLFEGGLEDARALERSESCGY